MIQYQDGYHDAARTQLTEQTLLLYPDTMTTPAALQQAAQGGGLFWDASLTPPRLRGGPAAPGAQATPIAPGAYAVARAPPPLPAGAPAAHRLHCDDRAHTPASGHPCSSNSNAMHPFGQNAERRHCRKNTIHGNGVNYEICLACTEQIQAQPWYTRIRRNITRNPGLPSVAPQSIATYTNFRTHLCRECEIKERCKLLGKIAAATPLVTGIMTFANNPPYPWNTCTCEWPLTKDDHPGSTLCIRHRHRTAGADHNLMLITRQQNDQWLRETGRDPNKPNRLIRLSKAKVKGRATRGIHRGCRCGAEIKPVPGSYTDGQKPSVVSDMADPFTLLY